jgi:phosphoglycolate phosphatase
MRFDAVLFDLDGTLLDTLHDLAQAGNFVLAKHGFPIHDVDAYRYFVGDGVLKLFGRALPPQARDEVTVARCAGDFRDAYARCWHLNTRPYPGVSELLQALTARQVKLAVLSNKPDDFTQRCVREKLRGFDFRVVFGQRSGVALKPDPAGALEIRDRLGVPAHRIIYVGDSGADMETAKAAGMLPLGALWGFRTIEELQLHGAQGVLQQPLDLLRYLEEPASADGR